MTLLTSVIGSRLMFQSARTKKPGVGLRSWLLLFTSASLLLFACSDAPDGTTPSTIDDLHVTGTTETTVTVKPPDRQSMQELQADIARIQGLLRGGGGDPQVIEGSARELVEERAKEDRAT